MRTCSATANRCKSLVSDHKLDAYEDQKRKPYKNTFFAILTYGTSPSWCHRCQTRKPAASNRLGPLQHNGLLRCGWFFFAAINPSFLPRAPDGRHDAGRLWQGCPNTAASYKTFAAVFPLKSVGGRSWSCISPALSSRPVCQAGSRAAWIARAACPRSPPESCRLSGAPYTAITRGLYLHHGLFSFQCSVKSS